MQRWPAEKGNLCQPSDAAAPSEPQSKYFQFNHFDFPVVYARCTKMDGKNCNNCVGGVIDLFLSFFRPRCAFVVDEFNLVPSSSAAAAHRRCASRELVEYVYDSRLFANKTEPKTSGIILRHNCARSAGLVGRAHTHTAQRGDIVS